MIVDLSNTDDEIVEEVLVPDFPFKEIIKKQIKSANTFRESYFDYTFIHFEIDYGLPKYPLLKRGVPVSMQYYFKQGHPVDFLLHIVNGYVSALEIMNVAGEKLIFNKDDVTKISFIYNDSEGNDVYSTAIANGMKKVKEYSAEKNRVSCAYAIKREEWGNLTR